jgi:hypothetical protein
MLPDISCIFLTQISNFNQFRHGEVWHQSQDIRVSVQGVKSLGGHFALLCREFDFCEVKKNIYRMRANITRGLYTFYPLFEVQKHFFKGLLY